MPPEMSSSLIFSCHPTLLVRTQVQREGTAVQGDPCPKACLQSLSAWQCTDRILWSLKGQGQPPRSALEALWYDPGFSFRSFPTPRAPGYDHI